MSTRVDAPRLPSSWSRPKPRSSPGKVCLILSVIQEGGNLWRYTLSGPGNSRLAYGKIIIPGHMTALRRADGICAGGTSLAPLSAACSTDLPEERRKKMMPHDLRDYVGRYEFLRKLDGVTLVKRSSAKCHLMMTARTGFTVSTASENWIWLWPLFRDGHGGSAHVARGSWATAGGSGHLLLPEGSNRITACTLTPSRGVSTRDNRDQPPGGRFDQV